MKSASKIIGIFLIIAMLLAFLSATVLAAGGAKDGTGPDKIQQQLKDGTGGGNGNGGGNSGGGSNGGGGNGGGAKDGTGPLMDGSGGNANCPYLK